MNTTTTTYVRDDARAVSNDVDNLLNTVGREAQAGAEDVRRSLSRVYDGAREKFAHVDESLRTTARHAVETTDDYVHGHPWRTVSIAALVGLAVGMLIVRR